METLIAEFVEMVRREHAVLKQLLETLRQQKQYLLRNEIEKFQMTVSEQENLLDEIRCLEETRISKVKEIAEQTGMKEDGITLSYLIESTLGNVSEELKELKKNLSDLIESIHHVNRVNELLIKRSLNFIQQNIGWMIDSSDLAKLYDPAGRVTRDTKISIMINKVL
ncbi:MAG: flagellar protein FlgN [bacterium]